MSYVGVIESIYVKKIRPSPNQLRVKLENLDELADSIQKHGLLQPIVVRPKGHLFEVVAGNRRFAAVRSIKLRKIGCHIIDMTDKEAFEISMVENLQQNTLNPIEMATVFKKYSEDFGWGGVSHLASRIGKSQEFVTKRLHLLKFSKKIQEEIIRRRISVSTALELLPLDPKKIETLADFAIQNKLTKIEVREMVKKNRKYKSRKNENQNNFTYEKQVHFLQKSLTKSISALKVNLLNFDDVIDDTNDWILKEILMQYRQIIHGDIDTFMRLRKKLVDKMPRDYFLTKEEHSKKLTESKKDDNSYIHLWQPDGVWR